YWMGVDKAAIENYNNYEKLVIEDWQEANISSAIEAYTLGNITYFPVNLQGETTTYFFTDATNKNRFEEKRAYTKFSNVKSGQEVRAGYTKMEKRALADTMYMCFLNKNNVSGVKVHVKMAALKLAYEYEEQEDSMVITQKALAINTNEMSIEAARDSIEQLKADLTDAAKKVEEDYQAALTKLEADKTEQLTKLDETQKTLIGEEEQLSKREVDLADSQATSKEDYVKEVFVLRDKLSKVEKELEALKGGSPTDKKKKKGTKQSKSKSPEKPQKGGINNAYVGGDLDFGFTNNAVNLRLSPFIAYYLIPKISIAIGPKVEYRQDFRSDKNTQFSYGGRAFVRGDVTPNMFAHVELDAMSRLVTVADSSAREWNLGLPIGGGYRQKIAKNAYFNIAFLFDVLNPKATANRNPLTFRGGITYDLGKMGKGGISKLKDTKIPEAPAIPTLPGG
ncbi:MAG: hypothetical protein AB8B69_12955, partial [Chitinophagales bacterium]